MTVKDNKAFLVSLGQEIAAHYDADVFFYSGEISDQGFQLVTRAMSDYSTEKTVALLILVTGGGSANSAFQIARLFQKTYQEFLIYVPSECKSAGTLLTLGAHRLILDAFSELGPLDVQLLEENELGSRKSGLLTKSAFEGIIDETFNVFEHFLLGMTRRSGGLISFRTAADLSASITTGVMAGVYSQINPFTVGSDRRALDVALHYGLRLIQHSNNAHVRSVFSLVNDYPSHDFIIDNFEARSLFIRVEQPVIALYKLSGEIGRDAFSEASEIRVLVLHDPAAILGEGDEEDDQGDANAGDEQDGGGSGVDGGKNENRPSDGGAEVDPNPRTEPEAGPEDPAKAALRVRARRQT